MTTCIIIDDEPIAHTVLENHLRRFDEVKIVRNFFNALDALEFLKINKVDFMFLDVEMPGIKGIELLRQLTDKPITIMTTAYRDYAVDGFELGVVDYLLKPISFERMVAAMKRTNEFMRLLQSPQDLSQTSEDRAYEILIKAGTQKIILDLRTISHAQGLKDYTILFTERKRYLVKGSIKSMEEYLPESHFIRVHRSFIVARDRIKFVNHNKIEVGDLLVPIGRHYKDAVNLFLNLRKPSLVTVR